ncbi:hypothetical protein DACRYDRAFT_118860 [Dacryopinax primogenitus]|uniref:Uncharacterized protein n=1 Tax=Dacryopinax primogenitus (strain DJM 731) TaxID=1858805 RepID=M5FSE2_DACPD|nr:uncharacterized protein DACRYDRAFT_118860 [Dacryopinax primogenitus]EJT98099.1 hypothetical protein DACRYDRAFT_118860 [Dacryopinax primogenitus]
MSDAIIGMAMPGFIRPHRSPLLSVLLAPYELPILLPETSDDDEEDGFSSEDMTPVTSFDFDEPDCQVDIDETTPEFVNAQPSCLRGRTSPAERVIWYLIFVVSHHPLILFDASYGYKAKQLKHPGVRSNTTGFLWYMLHRKHHFGLVGSKEKVAYIAEAVLGVFQMEKDEEMKKEQADRKKTSSTVSVNISHLAGVPATPRAPSGIASQAGIPAATPTVKPVNGMALQTSSKLGSDTVAELNDLVAQLRDMSLNRSMSEILQDLHVSLDGISDPVAPVSPPVSPSSVKRSFEEYSSGDEGDDEDYTNRLRAKRAKRARVNVSYDSSDDEGDVFEMKTGRAVRDRRVVSPARVRRAKALRSL